jgi:hypothetical protein
VTAHSFLRDDATFAQIGGGDAPREVLSGARTYFVRTDGNDANTGLVNSAGGAFLTPQHAYDTIAGKLDLGGNTATIQIGDGTYAAGINASGPWTGGGSVAVLGNLATPANVLFNSGDLLAVNCALPGILTLRGVKGAGRRVINHNGSGQVQYSSIDCGVCTGPHFVTQSPGAYIQATGSYTISGGAAAHWRTFFPSVIEAANNIITITLTGTPAFSAAFADGSNLGIIYVDTSQVTMSGAATGKRYNGVQLALINTNGGGANYFPGNAAGTTDATSVYA